MSNSLTVEQLTMLLALTTNAKILQIERIEQLKNMVGNNAKSTLVSLAEEQLQKYMNIEITLSSMSDTAVKVESIMRTNEMIPYALIKKGTEHNPEFLTGHRYSNFKQVPQFGILAANVLQLVIFFDIESADFVCQEIGIENEIETEIFNLVTMEAVK